MKKITILIFMLCYAVSLAGCRSSMPQITPSAAAAVGYTFSYDGVLVTMKADAAPVIAALGEPESYTEETSCAFDGLDKTYYYGSFYMTTYPMEGKDYIYQLWFADDQVTTEEGVRIGDPQSKVEEVYGGCELNGCNAYVMTGDDMKLVIIVTDGVVSSIQYSAIVE